MDFFYTLISRLLTNWISACLSEHPTKNLKSDGKQEAATSLLKVPSLPTTLTVGFWEDPPGYFDDIVWPCYIKDHQHLFENGDVNATLRENIVANLQTPAYLDLSMQELLMWAMGSISDYLQSIK